jgi:uncharacterized protein
MNIEVDRERIEAFCRKWKIREFALFGSVLRDDFRPDSDVDVLVVFEPDAQHTLFDRVEMQEELKEMFGREVDLVRKDRISNPYRRRNILAEHRVVHAE